jgi:hypothetical protein
MDSNVLTHVVWAAAMWQNWYRRCEVWFLGLVLIPLLLYVQFFGLVRVSSGCSDAAVILVIVFLDFLALHL